MNITISAKDFSLTPSLKTLVESKLEKLVKYHPHVQRFGAELDVDHNVTKGKKFRIEVWAYLPGRTLSAGVKAEHMEEALDLVIPKLERQLVKAKELGQATAQQHRR